MIESLSGKTGVGDGGSRGQDWVTAIISRKIEKKMEKKTKKIKEKITTLPNISITVEKAFDFTCIGGRELKLRLNRLSSLKLI